MRILLVNDLIINTFESGLWRDRGLASDIADEICMFNQYLRFAFFSDVWINLLYLLIFLKPETISDNTKLFFKEKNVCTKY